jgi:ATP-dependent exoDNAse (exonuclease V) beta subunit
MQEISELERRITAALERIAKGFEQHKSVAASRPAVSASADAETQGLQAALDDERIVTAQLQERLKLIKEKELQVMLALQQQVDELTKKLAGQTAETSRLGRVLSETTAALASLTDASLTGVAEPTHINASMMTELQALRALRAAEAAQIETLVDAIYPLIEEAPAHA